MGEYQCGTFLSDFLAWLSLNEQNRLMDVDKIKFTPRPTSSSATGAMKANNLMKHHFPIVTDAIKVELKNNGRLIGGSIEKNKFKTIYAAIPHLGNGCVIDNYPQYFSTQPLPITIPIEISPLITVDYPLANSKMDSVQTISTQFIYWISQFRYNRYFRS